MSDWTSRTETCPRCLHEWLVDTPTPVLDVERLAKAMKAEAQTVYYGTDEPVDWQEEDRNIAAEYARLGREEAAG